MKKTYNEPKIKALNIRFESHIATLSKQQGGNTITDTIDPKVTGNGGDDVLGKEEYEDFGW